MGSSSFFRQVNTLKPGWWTSTAFITSPQSTSASPRPSINLIRVSPIDLPSHSPSGSRSLAPPLPETQQRVKEEKLAPIRFGLKLPSFFSAQKQWEAGRPITTVSLHPFWSPPSPPVQPSKLASSKESAVDAVVPWTPRGRRGGTTHFQGMPSKILKRTMVV